MANDLTKGQPAKVINLQQLKDIENAQAAIRELETMIPERVKLQIQTKTSQAIADYLRHGEGGRLALLHLALTVNLRICKDEL